MDRILRIIVMMAIVLNVVRGTAQESGGMGRMPGTNVDVSYNKSGGNITDCFTAKVAYKFFDNKHVSVSANAGYHYMDADFSDCGADVGRLHDMDGSHKLYKFGVNTFIWTTLFGKPFMGAAMVTSDFSHDGFERVSGMGGGMVMLTMTRETQFGLGAFLLINTSSKWPLFPMFIYHHDFSPSLALNFYGQTVGLDYAPTKKDKFTAGFDIDSRTFYFRPGVEGLPETCRYTANFFRPMVRYRRVLAKGLNAEVEVGEEVKMSSRIYGKNGTRHYMDISQSPKPFVAMSLGYSL